jgi:putative hydrolase of the HAD superfamily
MRLSGIQAVYFDAVGTLIHPEPPAAVVYAEVARRFGSSLAQAVIAERFKEAFGREETLDQAGAYRTSEEREVRRWQHIVASVLDDVTDPDACFKELYQHFGQPEAWRCDPQASSVLNQLAASGYVLGMASNYDQRLRRVVSGKTELRLLTRLVISSEVGWRKPAAEFFAALCRSAGMSAERILYVGDDPANDYRAAENAGLRPLLLDRKGKGTGAVTQRVEQLIQLVSDM